jgi:hypothetical protein
MHRWLLTFIVVFGIAPLIGCASSRGGDEPAAAKVDDGYPEGFSAPPAGHKLGQVAPDMNDIDVRKVMGEPDESNAYMTGKAWIPFYYGPDTSRSDWMYKGQGRVVFSRNRYTGALKVIRVLYNPNEG